MTGHAVVAVAEQTAQIADSTILQQAVQEERVVITNNKDFGELVFRDVQTHKGIPRLRLQDETPANRVRGVAAVVAQHLAQLPHHFTIATETSVRIRAR